MYAFTCLQTLTTPGSRRQQLVGDSGLSGRGAGEEPLSEEPPEGMFKPVAEPNQLDNMLLSNQMER